MSFSPPCETKGLPDATIAGKVKIAKYYDLVLSFLALCH